MPSPQWAPARAWPLSRRQGLAETSPILGTAILQSRCWLGTIQIPPLENLCLFLKARGERLFVHHGWCTLAPIATKWPLWAHNCIERLLSAGGSMGSHCIPVVTNDQSSGRQGLAENCSVSANPYSVKIPQSSQAGVVGVVKKLRPWRPTGISMW